MNQQTSSVRSSDGKLNRNIIVTVMTSADAI